MMGKTITTAAKGMQVRVSEGRYIRLRTSQ